MMAGKSLRPPHNQPHFYAIQAIVIEATTKQQCLPLGTSMPKGVPYSAYSIDWGNSTY